jgi:hypothetical protein
VIQRADDGGLTMDCAKSAVRRFQEFFISLLGTPWSVLKVFSRAGSASNQGAEGSLRVLDGPEGARLAEGRREG